jgi:protein TonB
MHSQLLTCLFICLSLSAYTQENRIYYDESWQECKKKHAEWYRDYTPENGLYKIEDHYADGPLYMTGYRTTVANSQCRYREGTIVFYDRQGYKLREGAYKNGVRIGVWKHYYKNSNAVRTEVTYKEGSGEVAATRELDSATQQLRVYPKDTTADGKKSFTYTEKMPKSSEDLNRYIAANLKYPKLGQIAKIEGKVLVKFIVDEDGAVAEPRVVKGLGGEFDDEALRVVSEMPYWQPGYQNGTPVRVYFTFPIVFKLK